MNKKGALFVVERGIPQGVWQLEPKRQLLADTYNGEPLDCLGGPVNDLTADSKGGVYFTMGGVYYANPKGVVTKYGTLTGVNGIVLSPDEKTLYVTGRIGGAQAGAAAPAAVHRRAGRPLQLVQRVRHLQVAELAVLREALWLSMCNPMVR